MTSAQPVEKLGQLLLLIGDNSFVPLGVLA